MLYIAEAIIQLVLPNSQERVALKSHSAQLKSPAPSAFGTGDARRLGSLSSNSPDDPLDLGIFTSSGILVEPVQQQQLPLYIFYSNRAP